MQMKKYKLGEICENITDGEHGTVVDSPDGEYFLLSNKNIVDGKIVINTTTDRRIDKQTFEKINKRTKLEKNDVLISTVGTLGKLCIIEDNLNYTVQRSVGIIKPNQEKLKSIFLKYLLMTGLSKKKRAALIILNLQEKSNLLKFKYEQRRKR